MTSYGLLDQQEEDALHKSRLLNVEEKPFKRISRRLLDPSSLTVTNATLSLPTPPPDDPKEPSANEAAETEKQKRLEEWRHFFEDAKLDFAAFEGSIARIQFLLTSNEKERERYAAERLRILSTMDAVRGNTAELRVQLEEAQRLLALRKSYDELADKITSNRLLKPREDQTGNLAKLRTEIVELERESTEYAATWSERREQFGRIVEEGMQMRRLIRDEKEEVERREGMQEGGEGDEGDAAPSKGKNSEVNTPRADHGSPSPSQGQDDAGRLHAEKAGVATGAATDASSPLRQVTTAEEKEGKPAEQEDANMVDEGEVTGEETLEEGEEVSDDRPGEKMDIT